MLGILRIVEQAIKLLTIVLSIYEFPWENSLAVLEVLILVCSSDLPRGTLSTCCTDTPILGSGHVRLYPLDTVPTASTIINKIIFFGGHGSHFDERAICYKEDGYIQHFFLKLGDSGTDHPNDNGPNVKHKTAH